MHREKLYRSIITEKRIYLITQKFQHFLESIYNEV